METTSVTAYVPHESSGLESAPAWEVLDRYRYWRFNTLEELASSLKNAHCALSPAGMKAVARHFAIKTAAVRGAFDALGVGASLKAAEMVGRVDARGNRIVAIVRRARDGRGSPGTVYSMITPAGEAFKEFVHSCNQHTALYALPR